MPHLPYSCSKKNRHLQETPPHCPLVHPFTRIPENGFNLSLVLLFSTDSGNLFVQITKLGSQSRHMSGILPDKSMDEFSPMIESGKGVVLLRLRRVMTDGSNSDVKVEFDMCCCKVSRMRARLQTDRVVS
jgi:hypothetical protein